ncbi:pyridoxamine 5'-phosphate oxidase family protein [Streptomyces sp. NPDC002446]
MSPYHRGERAVQERAGERDRADRAARTIRDGMSEVVAAFLGVQQMAVVGARDPEGRVWASLLTGPPGLARATGPHTLSLARQWKPDDPLARTFAAGPFPVGTLFTDVRTRLRLRINGTARPTARGFAVDADQVFTNCPGQLRKRDSPAPPPGAPRPGGFGTALSPAQQAWIAGADTFFISSASDTGAVDASHRGGEPGFLRVVSPTELSWPDYPGNAMFMTLGNLAVNPSAGLLFLDWADGRTLQLTGTARTEFTGADRTVRFTVTQAVET